MPYRFVTSAGGQPKIEFRLFLLWMIGFVAVLSGVVISVTAMALSNTGSASSGIFIYIGPIPIVFGSGPAASWLILFSIMLTVLSIIGFYLMRRKAEKTRG